jgi:hypothetical protein
MPKAARKNSTKSKTRPREGLDLIDASHQRKNALEPDLKSELKLLRQSNNVVALGVLYAAYTAAAEAIQGIENQPRAEGIELLDGECSYLIAKAWTVAEQLARMRPSDRGFERELFVETLFDCAIQMGCGVDGANSVLQAAMAVGTAK